MKNDDNVKDIALLPEPIYTMAQIVGLDKALELAKQFSGESLYIPKYESVMRQFVIRDIISDFNGYNYKYLAKKYNLSERYVRTLCSEFANEKRHAPSKDQISIDDIF